MQAYFFRYLGSLTLLKSSNVMRTCDDLDHGNLLLLNANTHVGVGADLYDYKKSQSIT